MFFSSRYSISSPGGAAPVNYSELLAPGALRRMSPVLKMSAFAGLSAIKQADTEQIDGILVGTGLGCVDDTLRFLDEFTDNPGPHSPTSFIQSTHNTIAGQIALLTGIRGMNSTFSQQGLSFEMALLEAQRLFTLAEAGCLLVGGADEMSTRLAELLGELARQHRAELPALASGAAFFVVEAAQSAASIARLTEVRTFRSGDVWEELKPAGHAAESFDLVLDGTGKYSAGKTLNYKERTGESHTSTALALDMALAAMENPTTAPQRVLIVNSFFGQSSWIVLEKE